MAGPPITYDTPLTTLIDNNVTVAIGVRDEYAARNTRFDMAWVCFFFFYLVSSRLRAAAHKLTGCSGIQWKDRQVSGVQVGFDRSGKIVGGKRFP